MRAVLFHNPTSGSKGFEKEDILAALKLADIDATYVSTKDDELEAAFEKKVDLFIAAGGDGTIRTVVSGARDREIPVAVLPLGTANNVARSLGIAGTPQELVETWDFEHSVRFDIGCARGAWGTNLFVESFGIGLVPAYLRLASKGKKPEGAANLQQGRELLQKALKKADPVDVEVTIEGKKLKGEFFGVEVLNVPFTGPGLPLGSKADAADGKLDVTCFETDCRKDLMKWLDAPMDEPAPVLSKHGGDVNLLWRDAPNRIDDKSFDNEDKTHTAEIVCDEGRVCVLIPRKLPAQKKIEEKAEA